MRDQLQQHPEQGVALDLRMDDKRRLHRQKHRQQETVQEGLVVGYDERSLVDEYSSVASHGDAKQRAQQHAQHGLPQRTMERRPHHSPS